MNVTEIKNQIMQLPYEERTALSNWLLESLEESTDADFLKMLAKYCEHIAHKNFPDQAEQCTYEKVLEKIRPVFEANSKK